MKPLTSRMMPTVVAAALGLAALNPGRVKAAMISIDPGAVGSSFQDKTLSFNDLNGTALDGQSLSLDFVLSEMKHLVPVFNDPNPGNFSYIAELTLFHDFGAPPFTRGFPKQLPSVGGGFLSDENGNPLFSGFGGGGSQDALSISYLLDFSPPRVDSRGADGVIHHDVHFNSVPLPNQPSAQITGGALRLSIDSPQGEIQVGEWAAVPEPSTLVLWSLGAVGLAGLGYRRRKQAAVIRLRRKQKTF